MTSASPPLPEPLGGAASIAVIGDHPRHDDHRVRRVLLSLAVAFMGLVDLFSALLSHPSDRLRALVRLVPTGVLDTSRTFTLLAGALLLVTAWGLRRGKRRAFVAALLLCAVSVPVNLLKAIDFEEATVAAALMFCLGISGEAFRVRSRDLSLGDLRSRAAWAFVGLVLYAVAGAWIVKSTYGYPVSLARALSNASYELVGIGEPAPPVPQRLPLAERRIIGWYLHSLPVLSLTFLLGFAIVALRPVRHRRRHRATVDLVSRLVREHGVSSVSAFALDDDSDYFFSANRRALIAYRFESDTLLAIGDPIGPPEELPALLADFERFCRDHDWQFAFFQARPEMLPFYRERGWRALHIGEDPILWTDRFTLEGAAMGDARRMARRAEVSGLEVRHFIPDSVDPGTGAFDPARDGAEWLDALRSVSNEWLHAHVGGERSFCMGRFDPERLGHSWLAIAFHRESRRLEGFVTWVPISGRRGWALDLMRRRGDAATGTMELLIARSVETARARGDALLSLSLSALASVGPAVDEEAALTPESNRAREFLMEHLARFYDFKGLFRWKKKFDPAFEDRYFVYATPFAVVQATLALVRLQSPGGLATYWRGFFPRRGPSADLESEPRGSVDR
jgi:phosphatidylglycerol lysyltransferase